MRILLFQKKKVKDALSKRKLFSSFDMIFDKTIKETLKKIEH